MLRPTAFAAILVAATASLSHAQTLRGSGTSMVKQHNVAVQHDYTFLDATSDVKRFIELGLLVPIKGDANYTIHAVSFPYGRPAVRTFVERLAAQYRSTCGEQLVVTSLTRPVERQPGNASTQSVHPAGMAVDLRISNKTSCRRWLERTLLSLEKTGVLEATRERNPAHYHIAVFPTQYLSYVSRVAPSTRLAANTRPASSKAAAPVATEDNARATTNASSTTATTDAEFAAATTTSAGSSTESATGDAATTRVESPDGSVSNDLAEAPAPRAAPTPAPVKYRVRRGDTLWSIARANNTTIDDLKRLNGIRGSSINAGITIIIAGATEAAPQPTSSPPDAEPTTATYRVRRGDSLWSIARAHSTTIEHIRELNGFSGNAIKAGQIVTVPTGR